MAPRRAPPPPPVIVPQGTPPAAPAAEPASARQWVSEIARQASGTRAPSEEEIATCVQVIVGNESQLMSSLTTMFPNMGREVIVRALQRRYACTTLGSA